MGHELPPSPQIDYKAEIANFVDLNRDKTISHGPIEGMPLPIFVQMQSMCEKQYDPGVDIQEAKAADLINIAAEKGLDVPQTLQHLVRIKDPENQNVDKPDDTSEKVKQEKASTEVEQSNASVEQSSKPAINVKHEQASAEKPAILHPEIMARLVKLETIQVKFKPEPKIIKPVKTSVDKISNKLARPIVELPAKPAVKIESIVQDKATLNELSVEDEITLPDLSETTIEQVNFESIDLSLEIGSAEDIDLMSKEALTVQYVESEIEYTPITLEQAVLTMEAEADDPAETEFSVLPDQVENYEEVEKTPAVAAAEFMLQVLPAVTQEVYIRVQHMQPEVAAEVAVQIESINIVADRLHVLVLEGNTEGEEAKQIEAYLKREYEQLLVAVGIEPTEEILNDFIRYIYSAEYQIREDINLKEIEVIDEGTHEKKLFDEHGVFSRAHAASINLSRRLDKSIGRLVVNYFSS